MTWSNEWSHDTLQYESYSLLYKKSMQLNHFLGDFFSSFLGLKIRLMKLSDFLSLEKKSENCDFWNEL